MNFGFLESLKLKVHEDDDICLVIPIDIYKYNRIKLNNGLY